MTETKPTSRGLLVVQLLIVAIILAGTAAIIVVILAQRQVRLAVSRADHSYLTDDPCAAPCWQGFQPGETSRDDVLATLNQLDFVEPGSGVYDPQVFVEDGSGQALSTIYFHCRYPPLRGCGTVYLRDDKFRSVYLVVSEVRFREVIDKWGAPDRLYSAAFTPDGGGCMLKLVWTKFGVSARYDSFDDSSVCMTARNGQPLSPDWPVYAIEIGQGIANSYWYDDVDLVWPGVSAP